MKRGFLLSLVLGLIFVACSPNKPKKHGLYEVKPGNSRGLASIEDSKTQEDYILAFNKKIFDIRHQDQIDPVIDEILAAASKKETANMTVVQLYALYLRPVKHLKGIVWRMRGVVEKSGMAHLMAVDAIKGLYYQKHMVGPHIRAFVQYIAQPNLDKSMFQEVSDVQNYLYTHVRKDLLTSMRQMENLIAGAPDGFNFDLDMYLTTGYDEANNIRFLSEKRRHKIVTKYHLYYGLADLQKAVGALNYVSTYNLDDAPEFINKMVKKSAINNMFNKLPVFLTPMDSVSVLADRKFKNLFTPRFRKEEMKNRLDEAYNYFWLGTKNELKALNGVIEHSNYARAKDYIVNPKLLQIIEEESRNRLTERIRMYETASKGETTVLTSELTGQTVHINIKALFSQYETDLKKFLPIYTKSDSKKKRGGDMKTYTKVGSKTKSSYVRHKITGKKVYSWNYLYGRPHTWNDPTFGGFLPKVTNENIYHTVRTLKTTGATLPFAGFLPVP